MLVGGCAGGLCLPSWERRLSRASARTAAAASFAAAHRPPRKILAQRSATSVPAQKHLANGAGPGRASPALTAPQPRRHPGRQGAAHETAWSGSPLTQKAAGVRACGPQIGSQMPRHVLPSAPLFGPSFAQRCKRWPTRSGQHSQRLGIRKLVRRRVPPRAFTEAIRGAPACAHQGLCVQPTSKFGAGAHRHLPLVVPGGFGGQFRQNVQASVIAARHRHDRGIVQG